MRHLFLFLICVVAFAEETTSIPMEVFGGKSATIQDLNGVLVPEKDGVVVLEVGKKYTVWSGPGKMEIIPVTKKSDSFAPDWKETDPLIGIGFAGGKSVHDIRIKATLMAREQIARKVSGKTETIEKRTPNSYEKTTRTTTDTTLVGSRVTDLVVTVAKDGAEQPELKMPEGQRKLIWENSANGSKGSPWVRCWVKVEADKVE